MIEIRGSLLTRTTLIFATAATAIVIAALLAFSTYVVSPLLQQASVARAASIELAANTYFELPQDRRADFELKLLVNQDLLVSPIQQVAPVAEIGDKYFRLLKDELETQFDRELEFFETTEHYWVNLPNPQDPNLVLQIGFSSALPYTTQQIVGFLVVLLASIVVVIASYILVRRIASPIQEAVSVTSTFRGSETFQPLTVEGPRELRELATSINQMAENVIELLTSRTALLAGISHDLRTPLTRLRLSVELNRDKLGQEVTEQFTRDLEQLDELLSHSLEYARGTQEQKEPIPLYSFLTSLIDGIDSTIEISWSGNSKLVLPLAPGAFSRVISNLVDNAMTYGKQASIKVDVHPESLTVHVLDLGPGIPLDERQRIFTPFYRLDTSRGGKEFHSGLGLAIVQQLCETYEWEVEINDREGMGSDLSVHIPIGPLH